MKKFLAFIGLMLLVFVALSISTGNDTIYKYEQNLCQYPYRSTNTETSCDNSDPCDPESAAKGGSGECSTAKEEKAVSYNIKEVEKAVESVGK